MPKIVDLTPTAGEIVSDCITWLQRALDDDGEFAGNVLLQLLLSDLLIVRESLAKNISRGYARGRQ